MQNYDKKSYQIPRKVTEGFQLFGLSGRDIAILGPVVIIDLVVLFASNFPVGGRIVFTVFTGGLLYMALSQTLSNGLKVIEYMKLLYRYYLVDQNVYTLVSSKNRRSDAPIRTMVYEKPLRSPEADEIVLSDWDEKKAEIQIDRDIEKELKELHEELGEWMAKPKNITNS